MPSRSSASASSAGPAAAGEARAPARDLPHTPALSFVPGPTLVVTGSLAASGLAIGAASESIAWLLAVLALAAALRIAWRIGAALDVPLGSRQRVLLLVAGGVALVAGIVLAPLGVPGLAILSAVLLGGAAAEAFLFPPTSSLEITRELPERLNLGTANTIALKIRSRATRALHVTVRDRAPWSLLPARQPGRFLLAPGVTAIHRYDVVPPARGAWTFEAVDLRLSTFPGLVQRRIAVAVEGDTHVYPNLREVARYALLLHRQRMQALGLKVTRKRGKGTEFDTLRDYQPDDEYRDISWKATARAGKLVTQTWRIERSQNVMILVEAGRMMSAQVPDPERPPEAWLTKLDHTIHAALVLAQTAALKEDRVGVLAFAEDLKAFLAPKRGRSQLTAIVDALHDLQPTLAEPDFERAFQTLKSRAKRRSLVAIFTDLLDEESARILSATLPLLLPQHLPLVVAVSDPQVAELAATRPTDGLGAFTGAVAGDLLQERRDILRRLRARGALVLDVAPGELTAAVVNKYLEVKARNLL